MDKKPKSIETQIQLLKYKGMILKDEDFAKYHLGRISYFRLKSYWWDMQSDRVNHIFKPNTCFEDVINIYNFDKDLRLILFDAIETIEITLRTKLIYYMSMSYGGLWYVNEKLFNDKEKHHKHIGELLDEFNRSGDIFVKEYRAKHNVTVIDSSNTNLFPESWVIFEVATFGTLSKIYKNLNHQLPEKSMISKDFGLNMHNELSSWLESISLLRNIVAHHSRIWGRKMVKKPAFGYSQRNAWLNSISSVQENQPYFVISTMLYLCDAINVNNAMKAKIYNLFDEYNTIPIYKLGFFNHWESEPLWKR